MSGAKTERDLINEKSAAYLSKLLKDPVGLAALLYRIFSAMAQAGFSEEQAQDMTKYILGMIIGFGGMAE